MKLPLLATAHLPHERTKFQNLVFEGVFSHWVLNTYLKERDPDRREALKEQIVLGRGGMFIADGYWNEGFDRTRFMGDIPIDEAMPVYPTLDRLLATASADTVILQIGSCSGREIAHFAKRFPQFSYIGTDIDPAMVGAANIRFGSNSLRFELARAHEALALVPPDRPLIVFSVTSLQYVQPEHLAMLMRQIAERSDTTLLLSETWEAAGAELMPGKSRWRAMFSYSHEYEKFASEAGLKVEENRLISNHKTPEHAHKKGYFMCAKTRTAPY